MMKPPAKPAMKAAPVRPGAVPPMTAPMPAAKPRVTPPMPQPARTSFNPIGNLKHFAHPPKSATPVAKPPTIRGKSC